MKADCRLVDGETKHEHPLPGICFLRGDSVGILVALVCKEEKQVYSLLVEQPRLVLHRKSYLYSLSRTFIYAFVLIVEGYRLVKCRV